MAIRRNHQSNDRLIASFVKTASRTGETPVEVHLPDGRTVYGHYVWLRSSAIICVLRAARLPCPPSCFCGMPASSTNVIWETSSKSTRWPFWRSRVWALIGLCQNHVNESVEFSLNKSCGGWAIGGLVVATSERLLEHFLQSCISDDQLPPWVVFTGSEPYLRWNQGVNEHWRAEAWIPFWRSLESSSRKEYLTRWGAPQDWIEALTDSDNPINPYFSPGCP